MFLNGKCNKSGVPSLEGAFPARVGCHKCWCTPSWYPILEPKERVQGWGTTFFVALPTVLNTTSSLKSPSLEDCRYLIS